MQFTLDDNTLNGNWLLKYFRRYHPGVVAAIERTGKTTVTLHALSLPRMAFTFDIVASELTEEEAKHFDRQVDTDKVCKVMDWQFHEYVPGTMTWDFGSMKWVEDITTKPPSEITG